YFLIQISNHSTYSRLSERLLI
ncbi:hypothetical protein D046_7134B, partial [Vibrio parahaemolyticus V-223/04]